MLLRAPRLQMRWRLERDGGGTGVMVRGRVTVSNHGLLRLLCERGMGIAVLTAVSRA